MPDIFQDFPVRASRAVVFNAVSDPHRLETWWTERSSGEPKERAEYELKFGPEYNWRAKVVRYVPETEFELEMTRADDDWLGTRVGFRFDTRDGVTWVQFHHTGWANANEHYRVTCHCWAMYLRVLRRFLEHGETVPYDERLDV